VLDVGQPWVTVQGFVIDRAWGDLDPVQANDNADHLVLRDLEVRNSLRDGIDIGGGDIAGCEDILIEDCVVHHMLKGSTLNQEDAHCIVATDVSGLVIRRTETYYCSGDSLQVGTDHEPWDNVLVGECDFWTGPLSADGADFKQGESPVGNAISHRRGRPGDDGSLDLGGAHRRRRPSGARYGRAKRRRRDRRPRRPPPLAG
jgi:hypothetical protein